MFDEIEEIEETENTEELDLADVQADDELSEGEDSDIEMSADDSLTDDTSDGELASFESEEVEELEYVDDTQAISVIESVLFASDKPQGLGVFKQVFKGTVINTSKIKKLLEELKIDYAGGHRGVTLEETSGGYQLRTKSDNMSFIKRMIKGRSFKLSGPALEVLSIVAYKQPCIKSQVDEIRGVESGHLLRGLMDRGLVNFAGKSDLPGKPMFYQTSRKFLEIFGLRNLNELPTLSEIDELLPEGIDDAHEENETLDQLSTQLSKDAVESYSESEDELGKITDQLSNITTSSDFFEQEKLRLKKEKDENRAQDIEDAMTVGEDVSPKDIKWLEKYKARLEEQRLAAEEAEQKVVGEAEEALDVRQEDLEEQSMTAGEENEQVVVGSSEDTLDIRAEDEIVETLDVRDESEEVQAEVKTENALDFALKDHDFVGEESAEQNEASAVDAILAAEDEPIDVSPEEEEVNIGDVNIIDLKNDMDALS